MTTHELAYKLLNMPNVPAILEVNVPEWYGGVSTELFQVKDLEQKECFFTDNRLNYVTAQAVIIKSNNGWK